MEDKKKDKSEEVDSGLGSNEIPVTEQEEKDEKKDKHVKSKHKKEDQVEKLEEEVLQLNDKYLRLYSEFDNYRRRTIKEKIDLSKTASAEVITSLLPVIDDLERAYAAIETTEGAHSATKDGIGLILNKMLNTLTQSGLEPMKALGEVFDTDFHEAITNIPVEDPGMKGKNVDVVLKGYLLNGKVIRFAKVVVGS
jgi:molecular chaperone GrpE